MHRLLDEVRLPSPILESRGSSPSYSADASETEIGATTTSGPPARDSGETEMQNQIGETFNNTEHVAGILQRLRREPTLRNAVLMAPTRGLAALGITQDDDQLVQLLEDIEAMDYQPNTTAG